MLRREFMKRTVGISAISLSFGAADILADEPVKRQTNDISLNGSLKLLNQWSKQSETTNSLFTAAFKVLEVKTEANYADVAADDTVQQICDSNSIIHLGGPMLGCVTPSGVRVWIRTLRSAKVEVEVTVNGSVKTFGPVKTGPETDMVAIVSVTGLKPSTSYPYKVLVDGKEVKIPGHSSITTSPTESTSGKVRIAVGTCAHRFGLGNMEQWETIRKRKPTAMLLGGDIAAQDRRNHCGLHRADYLLRDLFPAWKNFSSTIPVYTTWDDHDYFYNDASGIPKRYTLKDKQNVCDVYSRSWNNPSAGFGDERRGVFFRTRIGPCDVIMLDNRYFREGVQGSFLGDEQMDWLEKQLLDCKGPFIILSCGTMWSDYVSNGKDSWGKWDPEGRERIFEFIEKNRIAGVLLISGDRHGARGFRIPRPSGFEFYEFETASLGGRGGPPTRNHSWKTKLYGMSNKYAFGEFNIDATLPDPEVTFRLIADDAKIIYELKLKRSQLTPN